MAGQGGGNCHSWGMNNSPISKSSRREWLRKAALGTIVGSAGALSAQEEVAKPKRRNRIGISTYSFWGFEKDEYRSIEKCFDLSAEMGADGVEILQVQMLDFSNALRLEAELL